jgi:hypothetical protein
MSKYTISQAYPATPEEKARWARESNYFNFQPPQQNAPVGTTAAAGWGIPQAFMPHGDAFERVMAMFKREVAGVGLNEPLRPEYKWSVLSVCMAHFLWFRTPAGARWVLKFFGYEERPVLFDAYAYLYVSRDSAKKNEHLIRLAKDGGVDLRIFRRCERVLDSPVKEAFDEVITDMQMLMQRARDPHAQEPIAEASGDMYHWVSEQLRDWFLEDRPNKHWPTEKANRMSGKQWAETLKRHNGQYFYEAMEKVQLYKTQAYRLKDASSPPLWCGGPDMRVIPLQEYFPRYECNRFTEHQLDNIFRCSSCNKVRSCTPMSGDHKMCSNCFGSIVQKDDRPALDTCTMKECNKCPAHLSGRGDLVNLKNRLNREVHFPVQR